MDEGIKATLDVLYKEFSRVQAKSVATDDWFFRFLSIAIVPFLAFLAYASANPAYRVFIAALPFLSIIGVAVVLLLSAHYIYATSYAEYLERRMNTLLRGYEVRESAFNIAAYRKWFSPVGFGYILGLTGVAALNALAVPIIKIQLKVFIATHPHLPDETRTILNLYWPVVISTAVIFLVAGIIGVTLTFVACKRLSRS